MLSVVLLRGNHTLFTQAVIRLLAGHSPAVALVSACKRSSHIPEEFSGLLGQQ